MIPLQNNIATTVPRVSDPEGLTYAENDDQFAKVLETIILPGQRFAEALEDNFCTDNLEDGSNDIDEAENLSEMVLTAIASSPEPEHKDPTGFVVDRPNAQPSYNNLDANVTDPLIGLDVSNHEIKDVKFEDQKRDAATLEEADTNETLNSVVHSIVYSDQKAVTYKTDTFEGTLTLKTSATQPHLVSEEEIPFELAGKAVDSLVLVTKVPHHDFPSKDIRRGSLLITTETEGNRSDAEPQRLAEAIVLNSSPVTKELALRQREEKLADNNLSLPPTSIEPFALKGVAPIEQGSTFTENDTVEHEELGESLEALAEDNHPIDLSLVPKPSVMTTESAASLEKTIRISETGSIHPMYEAIADAHETLKPNESKTLTITLTPEELGVVHVELQADETGNIQAVLSLEKPETFKLFQQDIEQLKAVLKEIGIEESNVNLQLLADSKGGQQHQSEYVAWDERESLLARNLENKEILCEMPAYGLERKSSKHLDIRA